MPRLFNGTTDTITAAAGGLSGFASGTFAALCRRTNESGWHGIIATQQSGGGTWEAYLDIAPSAHATASAIWTSWNGTDHANTLKFTQADGWCLIAVTKATGTATPRYHKYVCATQAWTHDNGVGAVPNATGIPGGNIIMGNVSGDQLAGDVAAAAMYGRTFTDQEIESLASSWEVWLSYAPMGAWLFDQASTAQSLVDWTGGGADQTAISGTTVTTGSLPIFNQSDGGVWPAEITAAGGTSWTADAVLTATATLTAGATAGLSSTAALAATASLTAGATLVVTGGATLSVTATLTAAATRTAVSSAVLPVTAALTAGPTQAATAAAVLPVTATLAAAAVVGSVATLSVTATLSAAGTRTAIAAATFTGTATLTAGATAALAPAATLTAAATLSAAGVAAGIAGAALTILAVFAATGDLAVAFTIGALTAGSAATSSLTASTSRGGPT